MKSYELFEVRYELGIKFYFVSIGKRNVMKAIDFSLLELYENSLVYNLGFGGYNFETNNYDDCSTTGNGDSRMVFNTVLSAMLRFFEIFHLK